MRTLSRQKREQVSRLLPFASLAACALVGFAGLSYRPARTIETAPFLLRQVSTTLTKLSDVHTLIGSFSSRGPPVCLPEGPCSVSVQLQRDLDDLDGLLQDDPSTREPLDHLKALAESSFDPGFASADQTRGVIAEIESAVRHRADQIEVAVHSSTRQLAYSAVATGIAFLLLIGLSTVSGPVKHDEDDELAAVRLAHVKQLEDRLQYLESYDPLTGLPNRRHLAESLDKYIAGRAETDRAFSVLMINIDRFKYLDDLFGAEVGDELLKQVAANLRAVVNGQGIVARYGGPEFAVIQFHDSSNVDATDRAKQLCLAVSKNLSVQNHDFAVTLTVGIAVFPNHGTDARTLLQNAGLALGKAKSTGRNLIEVFDDGIIRRASESVTLERRLNDALRNKEFFVNYQPYCDLPTREMKGAEALLRWNGGDLGIVSPAKFIPLLEDTGMIVEVGAWILGTVCAQMRKWETERRAFPVAVNLSLAQFRDKNLVSMVRDVINGLRLDPRLLTLEVTESMCLGDTEFAVDTLKRLKDLGISISIDDFGTGYSSLGHLRQLPIDNLKIDMSFVREVSKNPDAASIVSAITAMARGLNVRTIAEGVETEEQRNILHLLRCDLGQGFCFSPAIPAAELERFMSDGCTEAVVPLIAAPASHPTTPGEMSSVEQRDLTGLGTIRPMTMGRA
jgi:diguanylate cyclase (GGDEF)-like protein